MASTKHSGPSITTGDSGGRSHAGQPVLHQHGVEVQRFGQMRLFPIALSYQAKTAPVSSIEDGVDATMRLAVSSELDGATGRYVESPAPATRPTTPVPASVCGGSARPWSGWSTTR